MDCGFHSQETFTRAFRRRFGMPPSSDRTGVRAQPRERAEALPEQAGETYSISETKIRRLHRAHLAFVRHVGRYEAVPETVFDTLDEWATAEGLAGPRIWMGIGHDAPGTTLPERLRFDAALVVPDEYQGGEFAVTPHAGPFATLPAAYSAIFPRVTQLPKHRLIGLPAVEI